MDSSITRKFRKAFSELTQEERNQAKKQFRLWLKDPSHPSLQFKPVGPFWSARVNEKVRALAFKKEDTYHWFWVGHHREYDKLLK
jgi:hypothetical protein